MLFFRKSKKEKDELKYLIVGLGNVGSEYAETRHNIGFKVLDAFAVASNTVFSPARYGEISEAKFKGRTFVLLKPSTYMNLSGKAVRYWLEKENIDPSNMIVVVDDLAFPVGTLRVRAGGSDGGHNGLKSIDSCIPTGKYPRLRCGIGNNYPEGHQVGYVLGKWTEDELKILPEVIGTCIEIIRSFGTQGIDRTMNTYNKKGVGPSPSKTQE